MLEGPDPGSERYQPDLLGLHVVVEGITTDLAMYHALAMMKDFETFRGPNREVEELFQTNRRFEAEVGFDVGLVDAVVFAR